jgi:hypothetical protein
MQLNIRSEPQYVGGAHVPHMHRVLSFGVDMRLQISAIDVCQRVAINVRSPLLHFV